MSDVQIPPLPDPEPAEPREPPAERRGVVHWIQPWMAIIIALAAIGVAAWEGLENRRHNRLMVQPRIGVEVGSGRDDQGEYGTMAIASTGLGPAVVRSFRVYLDGAPLVAPSSSNNPWSAVIEALSIEGSAWSDASIHTHAFGEGYFLPSGTESVLFEARRPDRPAGAPPLGNILERIAVDICYCSVYGSDCDRALVATREVETEACPGP